MSDSNERFLNKIFNPAFYLLWNGISKRSVKRHGTIERAETEKKRLINIEHERVFLLRPCFLYSCVKAGSKRIVYSKPLNETEFENSSNQWFVWSKDRKTIKRYFSLETARIIAKKCATMYNRKYIILRCIDEK